MKKNLIYLLTLILLSSFISLGHAFAETGNSGHHIIYQANEIHDLDVLAKRAESGITDKANIPFNYTSFLENKVQPNKEKHMKVYTTTQKLKTEEAENGDILNSYVTTIVSDVQNSDIEPMSTIVTLSSSYSKNGYSYDNTYSVRAYATIYWDEKNGTYYADPNTLYRLTSASGGWEKLDSSVSLSNREVLMGESGEYNVSVTHYPSNDTFSYAALSTWPWLHRMNSYNVVGVNTYITLYTRGSTWTWHLVVNKWGG